MLNAVSSGRSLANVTPLTEDGTISKRLVSSTAFVPQARQAIVATTGTNDRRRQAGYPLPNPRFVICLRTPRVGHVSSRAQKAALCAHSSLARGCPERGWNPLWRPDHSLERNSRELPCRYHRVVCCSL